MHYASSCFINLNNKVFFNNIIETILRDFFYFQEDDNKNEAVETHEPQHRNLKTKKPRHL